MATVTALPEQRIVLDAIPWAVYEGLLAAHRHCSTPRFTYDRGRLEIMSPASEHEELKHLAELFVEVLAEEYDLDVRGFGSTPFRREDLARGFEPDGCFYVQSAARIRGKHDLDLMVDPPPDVIIEIDFTSPSLARWPLLAQLGVPEIWHYQGGRWKMCGLRSGGYHDLTHSLAFPALTADAMTRLLDASRTQARPAWLRQVRAWVREHQPGEP